MRPAPFGYRRPETLGDALDILNQYGDEARLLAGGQSLMPMLTMRLVQPTVVVDINRIDELASINEDGEALSIGAMVRYAAIARDPVVAAKAPLVARAMPLVAHVGVRNRGTLGGSVSLADPAAESPACCLCLRAEMELRSARRGVCKVAAEDFFQGIFTTAAEPDEILTAVHIPLAPPDRRFAILEVAPRHGDFALAGLCAAATVVDGRVVDPRIVVFGVGSTPLVAGRTAAALDGLQLRDSGAITDAIRVMDGELEIEHDPQLPEAARRRMLRTLLGRALAEMGAPNHPVTTQSGSRR